ncbi:MAG: peptidylprolyl isomerase [Clostridia bacterium]|nr:peptidylprolyl isomerase [Clostridia bacterium]
MAVASILVVILIGVLLFGIIGNATKSINHPIATITFEGYEEPVVVELYPECALNTVKNFIALANNEFYDGLIIHRVEKDFVIQGGDPEGTGNGGPSLSAIDSSIEKGSDADKDYAINRRI